MKARIFLLVAMILVLVVASGAPVAAGDSVVPFKANFSTTCAVVGIDPDTGDADFLVWGTAWATHLGKSAVYAETGANLNQYPNPYWGEWTFTAANGDQLFATVEGEFTPPTVDGTFEITGGSGRFEGVTGAGDFWGWTGGPGSEEVMSWTGTLTK
jgi:hypothetical protein